MKSTIISMIIVLIVMVALPMIFLGDGNIASKLGFDGFGKKGSAAVKLPTNIKAAVTNERVEVYTWVDEHGIKQFSNTPPSDGGKSLDTCGERHRAVAGGGHVPIYGNAS